MKRILVTGGAGFIGSNLIENLLKDNHEIISLDCYFSGSEKNHLSGVKYINGYTWDISKIFNNQKFDIIYHFGEYSRIVHSFEDIEFVAESILRGTPKVIEFAKKVNAKLIYSASSSKFGNNGNDQDLSPYAWMKSKMVELIKNYKIWFDFDYEICYFFNVYGPRQIYDGKYATVIAIFEKQLLNNKKLTIVKPGTQSRDFTHVNDIINGLQLVAEKSLCHEWHLRSGKNITINDLAKLFSNNYTYINERNGERFTSEEFESDTNEMLKWYPKEKLEDWIAKVKKEKI